MDLTFTYHFVFLSFVFTFLVFVFVAGALLWMQTAVLASLVLSSSMEQTAAQHTFQRQLGQGSYLVPQCHQR